MRFRRVAQREMVDINLASLIDVVFILLLFFVVTTTFTRETQLKVDLPQSESAAQPEVADQKILEIVISAEGEFALNGRALPSSQLASLMDAMNREAAGNRQLPVVISADAKTPHQFVIIAMDAAGKLGFTQLRISTVEADSSTP